MFDFNKAFELAKWKDDKLTKETLRVAAFNNIYGGGVYVFTYHDETKRVGNSIYVYPSEIQ